MTTPTPQWCLERAAESDRSVAACRAAAEQTRDQGLADMYLRSAAHADQLAIALRMAALVMEMGEALEAVENSSATRLLMTVRKKVRVALTKLREAEGGDRG